MVTILLPVSLRLRRAIHDIESAATHPAFPLLFDPQTAGGLLAGVPNDQAGACVKELQLMSYPDTRIIGRIEELSDLDAPIRIV